MCYFQHQNKLFETLGIVLINLFIYIKGMQLHTL